MARSLSGLWIQYSCCARSQPFEIDRGGESLPYPYRTQRYLARKTDRLLAINLPAMSDFQQQKDKFLVLDLAD